MYIAELRGKLSSRAEFMEDVLTSNVFSFFKYASRRTFLKPFLNDLGFVISQEEAKKAEFEFWPSYEDGTEPDVVIMVGNYYILFEAKYFSDFGPDQLKREADSGGLVAKNLGKQFHLVAITADYSEPKEKFYVVPTHVNFRWINWHSVTSFLEERLKRAIPDRQLAEDLHALLIKKNLRKFDSFLSLFSKMSIEESRFAFFDYISAKYRGEFIGFLEAFAYWTKRIEKHKNLFLDTSKEFSWGIQGKEFSKIKKRIFFGGKYG